MKEPNLCNAYEEIGNSFMAALAGLFGVISLVSHIQNSSSISKEESVLVVFIFLICSSLALFGVLSISVISFHMIIQSQKGKIMRSDGWAQYLNALKQRERSWTIPETIPEDMPDEVFAAMVKYPCLSTWHFQGRIVWVLAYVIREYGEKPQALVSDFNPYINPVRSREQAFLLPFEKLRWEVRVN